MTVGYLHFLTLNSPNLCITKSSLQLLSLRLGVYFFYGLICRIILNILQQFFLKLKRFCKLPACSHTASHHCDTTQGFGIKLRGQRWKIEHLTDLLKKNKT